MSSSLWRLAGLPRVVLIDVVSCRGVSCVCRRSYVSRRRSSGAEVITILSHFAKLGPAERTFLVREHGIGCLANLMLGAHQAPYPELGGCIPAPTAAAGSSTASATTAATAGGTTTAVAGGRVTLSSGGAVSFAPDPTPDDDSSSSGDGGVADISWLGIDSSSDDEVPVVVLPSRRRVNVRCPWPGALLRLRPAASGGVADVPCCLQTALLVRPNYAEAWDLLKLLVRCYE